MSSGRAGRRERGATAPARMIAQADRILLNQQVTRAAASLRGRVLDLGSGAVNRYLTSPDVDRIALDVSPAAGPRIVADGGRLPIRDRSMQGVLCTQVLEHVPDPALVLREIARVLERGGTLVLTVPQWNELHHEPHDYYRYTNHGLGWLLRSAGLELVQVEKRGGFWATLAQITVRYAIDRLDLYKSGSTYRFARPLIAAFTRLLLIFDRLDRSEASRRHCLGWLVIARRLI